MTQRVPAPHWVEAVQVLPAVLLVHRNPAWLSGATATRQVPCCPAFVPHWLAAARQFWEASGSCGCCGCWTGGCWTGGCCTGAAVVVVVGGTMIGPRPPPRPPPPLRRLPSMPALLCLLWLLALPLAAASVSAA